MKTSSNEKTWDLFFGNPIIRSYLTEGAEAQAEMDPGIQPESSEQTNVDIEQLTEDLKQGSIQQEDLVNMYKTGKITKDDIEQIIQNVESPPEGDMPDGDGMDMANQEPTEEELLSQQVDQTNDLFVKFSIYDKINELTDKLNYFKGNFEDIQSDTYHKIMQLREFLNILSSLVFNIETAVSYQMYGSILLQLTEIFEEYNQESAQESSKKRVTERKKEKYRDGDLSADPVDRWTSKNKSHLMPKDTSQGRTNEY